MDLSSASLNVIICVIVSLDCCRAAASTSSEAEVLYSSSLGGPLVRAAGSFWTVAERMALNWSLNRGLSRGLLDAIRFLALVGCMGLGCVLIVGGACGWVCEGNIEREKWLSERREKGDELSLRVVGKKSRLTLVGNPVSLCLDDC